MDVILTSTLFEQIIEGNKCEEDFKSQAHQVVVDKLKVELNIFVMVDYIRVWKRHYATITEIRAYTIFKWDEERKMVVILVEELGEWNKYCLVYYYVLIFVIYSSEQNPASLI